jgi:hypothetical protein
MWNRAWEQSRPGEADGAALRQVEAKFEAITTCFYCWRQVGIHDLNACNDLNRPSKWFVIGAAAEGVVGKTGGTRRSTTLDPVDDGRELQSRVSGQRASRAGSVFRRPTEALQGPVIFRAPIQTLWLDVFDALKTNAPPK